MDRSSIELWEEIPAIFFMLTTLLKWHGLFWPNALSAMSSLLRRRAVRKEDRAGIVCERKNVFEKENRKVGTGGGST